MSDSDAGSVRSFHEVFKIEREHLGLDPDLEKPSGCGIALSGGGIRSASFALGVVQALVNRGWYRKFHYLSTVSGGGYLGAALTWLRHCYKGDFNRQLGSATVGARSAEAFADRPPPGTWLDYIRQHGNYLEPGKLRALSLVAVVLRGVLLSVAIYGSAIAILFAMFGPYWLPLPGAHVSLITPWFRIEYLIDSLLLLAGLHIALHGLATWLGAVRPLVTVLGGLVVTTAFGAAACAAGATVPARWLSPQIVWIFPLAVMFLMCLFMVAAGLRALVSNRPGSPAEAWHYRARTVLQRVFGVLIGVLIALVVVWTVPAIYKFLSSTGAVYAGAGALSVGGALAAFKTFGSSLSLLKRLPNGLLVSVLALLAIYALLLIGYWVNDVVLDSDSALLLATGFAVLGGLLVDLNYIGPHRMYRDRLMEAFMPDREVIESGQWQAARHADAADIVEFRDVVPYHLVNCNAVLVDGHSDKFRGRGGDNFVIAPRFSGSTATGWVDSKSLGGHRGIPLATAMAISGAAVNPDAGGAGRGVTRDRAVSFLLSLFNVRLGYWLRNPGTGWGGRALAFGPPNFWFPGLLQGLFGRRLNEKASFLELSDGGHFDNTALYELVRRRVRFIVVSEAGADPGETLEDLAGAIERVRVDFGVHIRFSIDALDTSGLVRKGKLEPHVARGFAVATIHYPPPQSNLARGWIEKAPALTGYLLYLQAVPVQSMHGRPDVESYRRRHPDFPNESTVNQFFTEEQLEAYRELGMLVANEAIDKISPPIPYPMDVEAAADLNAFAAAFASDEA